MSWPIRLRAALLPSRRWLQFSLRSLLLLVLVAPALSYALWPKPRAKITYEGTTTGNLSVGRKSVVFRRSNFRLVNTSSEPLWFSSAGEENPVYLGYWFESGQWKPAGYFVCGLGMAQCELVPGEAVVFDVASFDGESGDFKVSLDVWTTGDSEGYETIWSPAIKVPAK